MLKIKPPKRKQKVPHPQIPHHNRKKTQEENFLISLDVKIRRKCN
jgi:hypothetical protein